MKTRETYTSAKMIEIPMNLYVPFIRFRYYGIIQIIHPFGEHIERYDDFARFLCNQGYIVLVNEYLGHYGALYQNEYGYFDKKYGWESIINDQDRVRAMIHSRYEDLPYFMISVGSGNILLQSYLMQYGDYIQGAIMVGMFRRNEHLLFKNLILNLDVYIFGNKHHSVLMDRMVFGHIRQVKHYNYDKLKWMSRDQEAIKEYIEDPHCGFVFTTAALRDITAGMKHFSNVTKMKKLFNECPLLLLNGAADPIGGHDAYTRFLGKLYRTSGQEDVQWYTYPDGMHFLLHDTIKDQVYDDILSWLEEHVYR